MTSLSFDSSEEETLYIGGYFQNIENEPVPHGSGSSINNNNNGNKPVEHRRLPVSTRTVAVGLALWTRRTGLIPFPGGGLTGDNGAMVQSLGYQRISKVWQCEVFACFLPVLFSIAVSFLRAGMQHSTGILNAGVYVEVMCVRLLSFSFSNLLSFFFISLFYFSHFSLQGRSVR